MKGLCFLVIAFALILSYQNNPLGTIIIGGIGILGYIFFKSRKRGSGMRRRWVFNKGVSHQQSQIEDLIKLLVVQSLLKSSVKPKKQLEDPKSSLKSQELEAMKNEILLLFDKE